MHKFYTLKQIINKKLIIILCKTLLKSLLSGMRWINPKQQFFINNDHQTKNLTGLKLKEMQTI